MGIKQDVLVLTSHKLVSIVTEKNRLTAVPFCSCILILGFIFDTVISANNVNVCH